MATLLGGFSYDQVMIWCNYFIDSTVPSRLLLYYNKTLAIILFHSQTTAILFYDCKIQTQMTQSSAKKLKKDMYVPIFRPDNRVEK